MAEVIEPGGGTASASCATRATRNLGSRAALRAVRVDGDKGRAKIPVVLNPAGTTRAESHAAGTGPLDQLRQTGMLALGYEFLAWVRRPPPGGTTGWPNSTWSVSRARESSIL